MIVPATTCAVIASDVRSKQKKMIKTIFVVPFIWLITIGDLQSQNIKFKKDYNNIEFVNNKINKTGVRFTPDDEHFAGRGIMFFKDMNGPTSLTDEVFTLVSIERKVKGTISIKNEVPTGEGMLELLIEVDEYTYSPSLKFALWHNDKVFNLTSSKVVMNKNVKSDGVVCVKVKCKGKSEQGERRISLKNWFYYTLK